MFEQKHLQTWNLLCNIEHMECHKQAFSILKQVTGRGHKVKVLLLVVTRQCVM